jgi:DNA mismatch repair protein MutS
MTNIRDLHIEEEVLPLLDFTHNDFSKKVLVSLVKESLDSVDDILYRQDILKGLISNNAILKDFSYSKVDLLEVYDFLEKYPDKGNSRKSLRFRLLFSEKEHHTARGKFIQFVLLFHKFQTFYFSRLNTKLFPAKYQIELEHLNDILSSFNLSHYESLIREQRFKTKHIVELSELVSEEVKSGRISSFWEHYFLFEAYLSLSFAMIRYRFNFPTFSDSTFSLENVYHPLLVNPVFNNFTAGKNVILLTGPNMSGKSTFLKAVSLCVYLGHIGLGVPALKAQMPFFTSISVNINLNDDLLNGYSHFMTEIINLKNVIIKAATNEKCFAVFDELFRGTNIEDAVEISTTTIKGLIKFSNSVFLISTHLHQLKEVEEVKTNNIATYYFDCELKENIPLFTYKLKEGWSDLRVGRILFGNEGLNKMLQNIHE